MRFAYLLLVTGCGIADFDVDEPVPEQQVQGSGIPAPLAALFPIPVSLDLKAAIDKQTTSPVGTIELSKLTLDITKTDEPSGDTDDWSFVTSIQVFVESQNLPKVAIAHIDSSPGAVRSFDFQITPGVDLKPYVDAGGTVTSEGKGTVPTDDVSYAGTSTFTVHPL